MRALLPPPEDIVPLSASVFQRAHALEALGLKPADALHIAAAETAGTDVFLTCDDRLLRTAHRHADKIFVRVANPLPWLEEQTHGKDA